MQSIIIIFTVDIFFPHLQLILSVLWSQEQRANQMKLC